MIGQCECECECECECACESYDLEELAGGREVGLCKKDCVYNCNI